jgi:hypothetical protein
MSGYVVGGLVKEMYFPLQPEPRCGLPLIAGFMASAVLAVPALFLTLRAFRRRAEVSPASPMHRLLTTKVARLTLALLPAVFFGGTVLVYVTWGSLHS